MSSSTLLKTLIASACAATTALVAGCIRKDDPVGKDLTAFLSDTAHVANELSTAGERIGFDKHGDVGTLVANSGIPVPQFLCPICGKPLLINPDPTVWLPLAPGDNNIYILLAPCIKQYPDGRTIRWALTAGYQPVQLAPGTEPAWMKDAVTVR